MPNPVTELRRFLNAALVEPVPRDHSESDAAFRRRRVVAGITLLVGLGVHAWALRIPAGNDLFYVAAVALALVWAVGALVSGPLHLGRAHTRSVDHGGRSIVQSVVLGGALLGLALLARPFPLVWIAAIVLLARRRAALEVRPQRDGTPGATRDTAARTELLRAGQVVIYGALGPMVPVTPGGRYTATLSGLGEVRASFTTGGPA